jgi:hypothetical protein
MFIYNYDMPPNNEFPCCCNGCEGGNEGDVGVVILLFGVGGGGAVLLLLNIGGGGDVLKPIIGSYNTTIPC